MDSDGQGRSLGLKPTMGIQRQEDLVALEIEEMLRDAYDELAIHVGPYDNLIGIFFHELVIYSTNYHLMRMAGERYDANVVFPFLNSAYARHPWEISFSSFERPGKGWWRRVIEVVSMVLGAGKSVALPFKTKDLPTIVFSLALLSKIRFEADTRYRAEEAELQLTALRAVLSRAANIVDARYPEIFRENFLHYACSYLSQTPTPVPADVLISGSATNLKQRILRARYLSAERPVIALAHGDRSMLTHDEPVIGYGELSYCTHYVDYGTVDIGLGKYNQPLQDMPVVIRRSSDSIEEYYDGAAVECVPVTLRTKILYVPTVFSQTKHGGNLRYGPFRDMEDTLYRKWQETLLEQRLDITYKLHPSSDLLVSLQGQRVETRPLEVCLSDYEVLFLDYISTGSALCAGTRKPIIYFNHGLRNLVPEARRDFNDRVFWVDVDLDAPLKDQIHEAIGQYNRGQADFENRYTPKYSIDMMNHRRLGDALQDLVAQI